MVDSERLDCIVGRSAKEAGEELTDKRVKCDDTKLLRVQLLRHQLHTSHTHRLYDAPSVLQLCTFVSGELYGCIVHLYITSDC